VTAEQAGVKKYIVKLSDEERERLNTQGNRLKMPLT
jgi:hypothetical protein